MGHGYLGSVGHGYVEDMDVRHGYVEDVEDDRRSKTRKSFGA